MTTVLNLEMACTDEMLAIAERIRPHQVTLVPERREEITTEGGLDVSHDHGRIADGLARLNALGLRTSLFIGPDLHAIDRSRELGALAIELHTGAYAHASADPSTLRALVEGARHGAVDWPRRPRRSRADGRQRDPRFGHPRDRRVEYWPLSRQSRGVRWTRQRCSRAARRHGRRSEAFLTSSRANPWSGHERRARISRVLHTSKQATTSNSSTGCSWR